MLEMGDVVSIGNLTTWLVLQIVRELVNGMKVWMETISCAICITALGYINSYLSSSWNLKSTIILLLFRVPWSCECMCSVNAAIDDGKSCKRERKGQRKKPTFQRTIYLWIQKFSCIPFFHWVFPFQFLFFLFASRRWWAKYLHYKLEGT